VKALPVRVSRASRSGIERTPSSVQPRRLQRRQLAVRFDAEKLKKLWSDPQKLKQVLRETDPD
jgi:hypothetical protein